MSSGPLLTWCSPRDRSAPAYSQDLPLLRGVEAVGASQAGVEAVGASQAGVEAVGASQAGVEAVGASQAGPASPARAVEAVGTSRAGVEAVGASHAGPASPARAVEAVEAVEAVGASQAGVEAVGASQAGLEAVGASSGGVDSCVVSPWSDLEHIKHTFPNERESEIFPIRSSHLAHLDIVRFCMETRPCTITPPEWGNNSMRYKRVSSTHAQ
eukprot:1177914-Prorocentrum_minimum.AAC.6